MTKAKELTESFNGTINKLIDSIESEEITSELEAFYKQVGKFTNYSLRNQILIMIQDPKATQVAGYKAWQGFDRQVTTEAKGNGIGILAPHTYKVKNDEGVEESRIGFHGTTVFDVRYTDGEPLIDSSHIDGNNGKSLFDELSKYSESFGMGVKVVDDLGNFDGICKESGIEINQSLSMQNRVGVLIHEIAHHLAGHRDSDKSKDMKEWEAESISFIVCEKFGIDNKAPQYLKQWGMTRDNIKSSLGDISKVASQLIDVIDQKVYKV